MERLESAPREPRGGPPEAPPPTNAPLLAPARARLRGLGKEFETTPAPREDAARYPVANEHDESAPSGLEPPPKGRRKTRILRFVLAALVFQLAVPLTYYLRDDPYDERFAWRMFSAVRLHRCRTTAVERTGEGEREIPLTRELHRAWVNHLSRNRRAVVHAFLRDRCEREGVDEVTLTNACVTPNRTPLEPQVYTRDCASGELDEPAALIVEEGR